MRRHLVLALALVATPSAALAQQASWVFRPSYYTHDPKTGDRVTQFAQPAPAYVREDPTYQQSGFRYSRSAVRVGDSYDYLHMVETWGQGESIRPYGEWLYPYRAGATPFGPWGNPQGPWTMPFDSWINPYGLGRYYGMWGPWGNAPYAPPAGPPRTPPGPTPPPAPTPPPTP